MTMQKAAQNPPVIRRMTHDDLAPLYALLSDAEVMQYIEPPFDFEKTERFLENAGLSEPPLIYAACDGQGDFIGYVIYHDYDEAAKEIGWVLKKSAWGRGFATALTRQLVERAKADGKNAVIECAPEQRVTKHIAQRFGFLYAGRREGCEIYILDCKT